MTDTENKDTGILIEEREYSEEEMNALIDGTMTDFDEGDIVSGTIVKVERDEVLVDIGYKSEGVIPSRELSIRKDVDPDQVVNTGDQIEALVLQKEDKDGRLILSKKRAEYERAWIRIEEKFNSGENVEGEVIEVVKGGLILDIGLRGFLPASLVDLRRVKDLAIFLGQKLECRVIEMDRNRNNVVLSRRVVLEEDRKQERQAILNKLVKGMILPGTVSSIVDFGAFVDLGGIDGLVHISELSWSHVNHPSEVVQVGDQVDVQVLDVDLNRERISLGLKQTTEDPWKQLVKEFPIGAIIKGRVTKLVPFGVFVELGNGVEGLVHISEMAKGHVETPEDRTSVGAEVMVKVMDVEMDRRRVSLSMRAAAEELGIEEEDEEEVLEAEEIGEAAEEPESEEEAAADEEPAAEAAEEPEADEPEAAGEAAADEESATEATEEETHGVAEPEPGEEATADSEDAAADDVEPVQGADEIEEIEDDAGAVENDVEPVQGAEGDGEGEQD